MWRAGVDIHGDRIEPEVLRLAAIEAWNRKTEKRNAIPVFLNFDYKSPPVGHVTAISMRDGDLIVTADITDKDAYDGLYRCGLSIRPSFSIKGWKKLGDGTVILTDIELRDFGLTRWPLPLPRNFSIGTAAPAEEPDG